MHPRVGSYIRSVVAGPKYSRDPTLDVQREFLLHLSLNLLQLVVKATGRQPSAGWEATSADRADLTVRYRIHRVLLCSLVVKKYLFKGLSI